MGGGTPLTEQNNSGVKLIGSRDQANTHTHTLFSLTIDLQTCYAHARQPDIGPFSARRRELSLCGGKKGSGDSLGNIRPLRVALDFSRHIHGSTVSTMGV